MGLQVHGREVVDTVITAVSASRALFEVAAARNAGLVVVHHGLFWDKDSRVIDPMLRERLRILFDHGINLAAYHLALDGHPKLGNNARIIEALGFRKERVGFAHVGDRPVGWFGSVVRFRCRLTNSLLESNKPSARCTPTTPMARPKSVALPSAVAAVLATCRKSRPAAATRS